MGYFIRSEAKGSCDKPTVDENGARPVEKPVNVQYHVHLPSVLGIGAEASAVKK